MRISTQHNCLTKSITPIPIHLPSVPIDPTLKPAVPSFGVNPIEIRIKRHRNTGRTQVCSAISRAGEHAVLNTPSRYGRDVHVVIAILGMVGPAGGAESEGCFAGGDGMRLVVEVGAVEGEEALSRDGRGRCDGIFGVVRGVGHFGARDSRGDQVRGSRSDSDGGFRSVSNAAAAILKRK